MSPHKSDCEEGLNGDSFSYGNGFELDMGSIATTTSQNAGVSNGTNDVHHGDIKKSPFLKPTDAEDVHDLVCVGFGPASLAIAVAMHDALSSGQKLLGQDRAPKVLFLEKQARFAWHAGMLLPGTKMQISFLKDLATLRDPRSEFTFLNYVHKGGRLVDFTNLGTFLPCRVEYEDYLRWCASFFEDVVRYNHQVSAVSPDGSSQVETFSVTCQDVKSGETKRFRARNVLLGIGGQPKLPKVLSLDNPRVMHSSQYAHLVPLILSKRDAPYKVAVMGAGQSAAEIFNNIQTLYPNSRTHLIMRSEFLRPSDDSPFINSIFNPSYVDELHPKPTRYRQNLLTEARSTNYGVVRLELIEQLYERMYDQKRELGPDEAQWPHRIMGGRFVKSMQADGPSPSGGLSLVVSHVNGLAADEVLDVDLVIAATGYRRNAHVDMLRDAAGLLPAAANGGASELDGWQVASDDGSTKTLEVGRDYRVKFEDGAVQDGSGIWLQGCCEGTHGISDTLLSVLATRSDEIIHAIFKSESKKEQNGVP